MELLSSSNKITSYFSTIPITLKATITPSNATNQEVTWSSSNKEIASVTKTGGVVTGVTASNEEITITATTANNRTAICKVKVTLPPKPSVTKVTANVESVYVNQLIKWTATGSATAKPIKYEFKIYNKDTGKVVYTQEFSTSAVCEYTPSDAGNYYALVTALDNYGQKSSAVQSSVTKVTAKESNTNKASWMKESLEGEQLVHSPLKTGEIGINWYHQSGWDFIAPLNTPIYALEDCTVTYYITFGYEKLADDSKKWYLIEYGNWAKAIGKNTEVLYAHMNGYPANVNGTNVAQSYDSWLIKAKDPNTFFDASSHTIKNGSFQYDGSIINPNYYFYPQKEPTNHTNFGDPDIIIEVVKNVKKGDLIGYVGNTGYSNKSHLHVEIKYGGSPIDELKKIRFPNNAQVVKVGDTW